MPDPIVRIATYARVSSDEQRDRHTVLNQRSALSRRLGSEPGVVVFKHYEDDGVSGTIPLEDRPAGGALARDARAGRFSQIWVVRADRLGRDAFELLRIWRVFESIGVVLRATDENIDDPFYFDIHAVIAANERRKFLERSAEGMNRAASEGRYTGGIVPLGYTVSGDRGFRRLVPDDSPMWAGLSAADVVRRIYHHLAVDGWTCPRIADEFNSLGIPTSYCRDGRGVRGRRTQGLWRSGHIRNLVVNSIYKGVLQYGRRSTRPNGRSVISSSVPPLVSDDVWNAALSTLKRNRAFPRNSCHTYLLRSLIRCAVCGLSFCGTWARGPRYRCNGSMAHRGPLQGKCIGASIKGEKLEQAVWSDVSRFLSNPGDLVDELLAEGSDIENHAVAEAERASLLDARNAAQLRRKRAIDLYTRAKLSDDEFDAIAADVEQELKRLDKRLAGLEPDDDALDDAVSDDVLAEIRQRLARRTYQRPSDGRSFSCSYAGLRSTPQSPTAAASRSSVVIDYRFPPVVQTRTGIAASHSYNLSPHTSPSETKSPSTADRPQLQPRTVGPLRRVQFDRCGEDTSKTRVSLRSTAPALLLQSPVQRPGRAIRFPDAERHAAARSCREGAFIVDAYFLYIRRHTDRRCLASSSAAPATP